MRVYASYLPHSPRENSSFLFSTLSPSRGHGWNRTRTPLPRVLNEWTTRAAHIVHWKWEKKRARSHPLECACVPPGRREKRQTHTFALARKPKPVPNRSTNHSSATCWREGERGRLVYYNYYYTTTRILMSRAYETTPLKTEEDEARKREGEENQWRRVDA